LGRLHLPSPIMTKETTRNKQFPNALADVRQQIGRFEKRARRR
jgi:hypothetical protein